MMAFWRAYLLNLWRTYRRAAVPLLLACAFPLVKEALPPMMGNAFALICLMLFIGNTIVDIMRPKTRTKESKRV